jgi:calcineurin-like phosphoesterase family protein
MIKKAVFTFPGNISIETYLEHPDQISYKKLISVIENEDPFISADYHLLKERLIVDDKKKEKQEESRSEKIVKLHNSKVKKNDYFLFLGDVHEGELHEGSDLMELVCMINRLNGKKILLCGNNDTQRWDYYLACGFIFATRSPITTANYIFSHEPIDIKSMGVKDDYINFHGHIHSHRTLFNMDYHNHINVYWEDFDGPLRLSEYLKLYEDKKLPILHTEYQ